MRRKIIFLPTVLLALCASSASAQIKMPIIPVVSSATTLRQSAAVPQRGALYRVRHQGNTTYLFGTIHVGKADFFPLEAEVTRALAAATTLVVELDIRNSEPFQAAVNKHGLYAAGDTIDKHLSVAGLAELRHALALFGVPFAQVAQMKPWLITNLLIGLDLERNGFQRSQGTEFFLLAQAKTQTKMIRELESADSQLALYDDLTEAQQEQYLRENLAEISNGKSLQKARLMVDAWGIADSAAFEAILRDALNEKTVLSTFIERTLLGKRNPDMATKIEGLLKHDRTSFVGVGLLHLIGENGLPKLLQQRGYEVQKLY